MMKYYQPRGSLGFTPHFIVQYPDLTGADRSVPTPFLETAKELATLPRCKAKGFWRIKYKKSL